MRLLHPCNPDSVRNPRNIGALFVFATLWFTGCNSGVTYYGIYGVMTLNGKPVEYAEVHIRPLTDNVISGRTVFVLVVNGKYDTRLIGGVPTGPTEWTIRAAEPGKMRIKNPEDVTSEERDQFLSVKQELFIKQIEIDREEIEVVLP